MNIQSLILEKASSLVIVLSTITVMTDVVFARLYNTILGNLTHDEVITFFILVCLLFFSVFWMVLLYVRSNTLSIKGASIKIARNIAWLIQIITSLLIVIVLLDVLFGAKYSQLISSYSELTGLVGGTILLIILARQLLHSFNSYKSNLLFIYTIAIFSTVFYFVITAALTYLTIQNKPAEVTQSWISTHVYLPTGSVEWGLAQITSYFQDVSFVLLWIASGLLLRHHFKKRRRLAFLILLSIPIIYFIGRIVNISYFISIFGVSNVIAGSISIVFLSITPLIGGIIFGLSFYYTSRSIPQSSKLRTYMSITGHGFIILLISSQYTIILHYPYPPFGMIAISSTYLGAYLLLIGIYSTALSSAQNIKIHNEISKIVQENSKISYEMGRAIFIDSIEKQVSKIGKRIEENSGIESASDPEELRDYIEQVIEEKKKGTLK